MIDRPSRQPSGTPLWRPVWLLDDGKIEVSRRITRGDFANDDAINRKLIRPSVSKNVCWDDPLPILFLALAQFLIEPPEKASVKIASQILHS